MTRRQQLILTSIGRLYQAKQGPPPLQKRDIVLAATALQTEKGMGSIWSRDAPMPVQLAQVAEDRRPLLLEKLTVPLP